MRDSLKHIKISVIIPVYNRCDVIQRAVESLLQQDFDQPYEIIVVDDGSTDETADVIEDRSPLVRVIRQENAGAAAARRTGIEQACGEFVAFLDSDDVAEPWHLSTLFAALTNPGHESPVVLSWARVADLNGESFPTEKQPQFNKDSILFDPVRQLLETGCFTSSMNLMTSREIAMEATVGREFLRAANDYDFTLRVANQGAFVFADKITIRCDRRDDGISRKTRSLQAAYAVIAAVDAVKQSGRLPELKAVLQSRIEKLWPSAVSQLVREKNYGLAMRVLKQGMKHGWTRQSPKYLWWSLGASGLSPVTSKR